MPFEDKPIATEEGIGTSAVVFDKAKLFKGAKKYSHKMRCISGNIAQKLKKIAYEVTVIVDLQP